MHRIQVKSAGKKLIPAIQKWSPNGIQQMATRQQSTATHDGSRKYSHTSVKLKPATTVTDLTTVLSDNVSNFTIDDMSDKVIYRSKRMILDSIGVGTIGSQTEIAQKLREFTIETEGVHQYGKSVVWGGKNMKMSSPVAAFLNGCSTHTMDFDDTWHPATHPSGPVLPALLSLVDSLPQSCTPSLEDVLVAFNIGIQVQGALLRCSSSSRNIPNRLHPPSIVGVMGSAAASARLLGLGPWKCRHSLAIAASFAGAPMANAGTMTKPLHAGKSARFGLEAALLADKGIEGNNKILDIASGFGAFYGDYDPEKLLKIMENADNVLLHDQDIAIKSYPCHLGMHWGIDAALGSRKEILNTMGGFSPDDVKSVTITAPKSKYINRPIPSSEHQGRHSFQFTVCSALLDGDISPETFKHDKMNRPDLMNLLCKTSIETPDDNSPSFDDMYVKVFVRMNDGNFVEHLCTTPYGHWRYPMSDKDVQRKFLKNTIALQGDNPKEVISMVGQMDSKTPATQLTQILSV